MARMYQPIQKQSFFTWGQDVALNIGICPQRASRFCGASAFAEAAHAILRFGGKCVFVIHRADPHCVVGSHVAIETLVFERVLSDDWNATVIRLCGEGDNPEGAGSETVHVDDTESAAEIAVAMSMFVTARARALRADWCLWYMPQ